MNLHSICLSVQEIARQAGEYIWEQAKNFDRNKVEQKGKHDFVSYVDINAEKMIVENLSKVLPEAGFITEENTKSTDTGKTLNWIIDPLDGTTNFIHGFSPHAVSIALSDNSEIILGVVYEIGAKECFYATKGNGAFLNGKKIEVSKTADLQNSLIATGFPFKEFHRINEFSRTLDYLMRNTSGIRRLGSAATDLVYVACGRFDAYYEYNINAWDVAAGSLIVKESGGRVVDFSGGENYIFGREIIAVNEGLSTEFQGIIKNIMCEK